MIFSPNLKRDAVNLQAGLVPVALRLYTYTVEARYAEQAWEIEVALPKARFETAEDLARVRAAFDAEHRRIYSFD